MARAGLDDDDDDVTPIALMSERSNASNSSNSSSWASSCLPTFSRLLTTASRCTMDVGAIGPLPRAAATAARCFIKQHVAHSSGYRHDAACVLDSSDCTSAGVWHRHCTGRRVGGGGVEAHKPGTV